MQEFHQDSYYLVTNERVKSVSSGDGSRGYQGLDDSPRPKVLLGSSLRTLAVGRFIAELIQLPYDASLADILRTLKTSDEMVLRSVAGTFDVACSGKDAKDLRGDFFYKVASCIRDVYSVCEECADKPAPVRSAANPTFSLRDEAFNDNIRRDTCMMLSQVQADLRLVTKLLRNTGVFPLEFVGLDVVPFQLVRCLHAHLLTQRYVQKLVIKSVEDAYGPHGTGALQQSLLARLRKPDVFLVAKIMGGTACNFTPAERLFGIYSVGHLAMYAATEDYVPSESPVVKALVDAAANLSFGT
jgi:hypothetical protein